MKNKIIIILILVFFITCGKNSTNNQVEKDVHTSSKVEGDGMEAFIPEESDHNHETHDHLHFSEAKLQQWGIQVSPPSKREFVEKISLNGVVRGNKQTTFMVNALATGMVSKIHKDIGDQVKRGEVLCELNSFEFLELKKRYIKVVQHFRLCKQYHDNAKELFKIKGIEQKELLKRETECKKSMAEYFSLESDLIAKGLSRQYLEFIKKSLKDDKADKLREFLSPAYRIIAPISGKVLFRDISLGEQIENKKTLFEISDTRRMWVILDALEKDLKFVVKKMPAEIVTDVYPGELFKGKIEVIMEKVDPKLRTIKVRVVVDNRNDMLKTDMIVRGLIKKRSKGEFFSVPIKAVVKIASINGIFLKDGDGFKFRPIEILNIDSSGFAFIKDLNETDLIVTKGAFYLKAEYEISKGAGTDEHAGHTH
jgi:cobalt-zinc-cadmium efflux system membrane fusion protein